MLSTISLTVATFRWSLINVSISGEVLGAHKTLKNIIEFIWSHVKKFEPKAMKVALELLKVCEI